MGFDTDWLVAELRELAELRDLVEPIRSNGAHVAARIMVEIAGRICVLVVKLPAGFPEEVPTVHVELDERLNIPHVLGGRICWTRPDTVLWDHHQPGEVLRAVVLKALGTLGEGLTGENEEDILNEWGAEWVATPGAVAVESVVEPGEATRELVLGTGGLIGRIPTCIADSSERWMSLLGQALLPLKPDPMLRPGGLYVPLRPGYRPQQPVATPAGARRILEEGTRDEVRSAAKAVLEKGKVSTVVFGLPRPRGGQVLFGFWFAKLGGGLHPLLGGAVSECVPLVIQRQDETFLRARGGAASGLGAQIVAVIGCGSVGGHIATELARAGVGQLVLVDHDKMRWENTFRHVLGRTAVGLPKASALGMDLLFRFPFLRVQPEIQDLRGALGNTRILWEKLSLIVLATGDHGAELALAARLAERAPHAPRVHTWLEPHGIGGHALLSYPNDAGCLRCVYTTPEEGSFPVPRTALVAPSAELDQDVSGCGNRYSPYAALDALRTATLATSLAVEVLEGQFSGGVLASWYGDPRRLLAAGATPTAAHPGPGERRIASAVWRSPRCRQCGT